MYYIRSCTYCTKIFYTYHDNKEVAAQIIYTGIKAHLVEYNEDHKEYQLDESPEMEINQMYYEITESDEEPAGGYELAA
jgi:hypothetical protein